MYLWLAENDGLTETSDRARAVEWMRGPSADIVDIASFQPCVEE